MHLKVFRFFDGHRAGAFDLYRPVGGKGRGVPAHPDFRAEAECIRAAPAAGGATKLPLQESFRGSYFGSGTDRFRVHGQVNVDLRGP